MTAVTNTSVGEYTSTAGTGALALSGASPGHVTFGSAMAVGDICSYQISDPISGAFEIGCGTYATGNTLARTTVIASSNGNAVVSLSGHSGSVVFIGPATTFGGPVAVAAAAASGGASSAALTALQQTVAASADAISALQAASAKYVTALLLDTVTASIAGAYGLRKLRAAYGGPAIQVTRSSDSTTQDIGFLAGSLDTVSLLAFCGSGDGVVSRWYDQGTLGQTLTPPSIGSAPKIVAGGVLVTLPNTAARPGMRFTAANPSKIGMSAGFALGGTTFALCSVAARTASGSVSSARLAYFANGGSADYGAGGVLFGFLNTASQLAGYQGGVLSTVSTTATPFQLASVFNGTNNLLTLDGSAGSAVAASVSYGATGEFYVGNASGNANAWDGVHCEHIVVLGALSAADQATIRGSQVGYYGTP